MHYALNHMESEPKNIGFLRGAPGVYTMCAMILKSSSPTKSAWCLQQLNQTVSTVAQAGASDYPDELDFGRAGLIMASLVITNSGLWPSDIIPRENILKIAHVMFNNGVRTGTNGVLAWQSITETYILYGQNHGSTGIMMQFFRLPELFQNATVSQYIKNTLDFFLTIQFPSGNFPTPLHPPFPSVPDVLVQWCHGGPGFVPVLAEGYLRFKDDRYLNSMQRATNNMWEKGLLTKGMMLCHGIMGNTYMFLYAYRITSDPVYLYRASKFQEFVLSHPEISNPSIMVQNYPYAFLGSSYQGALVLWSEILNPKVDYKRLDMPGFGLIF